MPTDCGVESEVCFSSPSRFLSFRVVSCLFCFPFGSAGGLGRAGLGWFDGQLQALSKFTVVSGSLVEEVMTTTER